MLEIQSLRIAESMRRSAAAEAGPPLERARGEARIAVGAEDGPTRLQTFFQSGSLKIRLPRVRGDEPLEAIFLNTAGGVTGGDRLAYGVSVGAGAHVVATSQAAERIYRRSDGVAAIETRLLVAAGGRLDWLPQETILFDRSALTRTLAADVDPSATFLAVEAIVLGRAAMGEAVRSAVVADSWRVRRGGKLVFADGIRVDGDATAIMAGGATGKGATALATLVLVAPDAESRREAARAALSEASEAGVSAWNGMLTARLLAPSGQALRADLIRLVEALRSSAMPRVWSC